MSNLTPDPMRERLRQLMITASQTKAALSMAMELNLNPSAEVHQELDYARAEAREAAERYARYMYEKRESDLLRSVRGDG